MVDYLGTVIFSRFERDNAQTLRIRDGTHSTQIWTGKCLKSVTDIFCFAKILLCDVPNGGNAFFLEGTQKNFLLTFFYVASMIPWR